MIHSPETIEDILILSHFNLVYLPALCLHHGTQGQYPVNSSRSLHFNSLLAKISSSDTYIFTKLLNAS